MKRRRKRYATEEKVAIVRNRPLHGVAVSDRCDQHGLHPTVHYRQQTESFAREAVPRIRTAGSPP
jgi:transposase-like protein